MTAALVGTARGRAAAYRAGLLSGDGLLVLGHVVMLPAMAAVILRH